jgi:hypothetical protein
MSTSAIVPVTGIDFDNFSATASQQTVFSNLLNQLQQAVASGDLTSSGTLLNAVDALSPSSASATNSLGTFLTSLGTALSDGSVSEAQSALSVYQSTNPTTAAPAASSANTGNTAAEIAAGLVQSQIQLNLVTTLLNPSASSSNSSSDGLNGLLSVLSEAYPDSATSASSAGGTSTGNSASTSGNSESANSEISLTNSSTPYDTLVSSIQAGLAGGNGTLTPALAYLQASGNFVNTSV